ncbi:MAG: GAF domain-containing protein [Anaerolineales bacterium]
MVEETYKYSPGRDYLAESDFVVRLRREYLEGMISGTLWAGGTVIVIAMIALLEVDYMSLHALWPAVPLLVLVSCLSRARRILDTRRNYNLAASLYIVALLLVMVLSMWLAPSEWEIRYVFPFLLTVISSASGLLLSRNRALFLTSLGMLALLPFAFLGYNGQVLIPALFLSGLAAIVASSTAGSLYIMAEYSTQSYFMARKRANDFFENKEQLRKALARQEWLYEELQKVSTALERRAVQLETTSEVGKQATAVLETEVLLPLVVRLIQSRFGYYFVGVWLVDRSAGVAELRAGMREGGHDLTDEELVISMSLPSILVSVCKSGESRLVEDVEAVPDYYPLEELPATRSSLVLPLHVGQEILGALDIESDKVEAFDEQDRVALQTLADQLAVALRNAHLYGAEQRRRQFAESLEQTGRTLSSSLDLTEVPERILQQLEVVVPYERGLVLIQEGQVLRNAAHRGFPEGAVENVIEIPIREGDVFQKIVSSYAPVLIPDVLQDASFQISESLPLHHSWLGVPLITRNRVVGMISLTREAVNAFTRDDAQVVLAFAAQAAIALENASLYAEITRFNEQLEQMVQERTEELKEAYHTLEKMDKNKSDFINVAAHELRTPLTVIKGYAQVMKIDRSVQERPPLLSALDGILAGTDRLHRIVNSMLDVARIDSRVLNIVTRRMHLVEIFARLRSKYALDFEERRLEMHVEGIDELPLLTADPGLLFKVFEQLVSNAIKYTPDGGRIDVRGQVIQVGEEPSFMEVVVEDTGIGIDAEHQDLIFEKFYQTGEVSLHSSGETKFKAGGPGLGLAIAKGIVEAHGGRIWVESPGCDEERCPGSRFCVWLPLERE